MRFAMIRSSARIPLPCPCSGAGCNVTILITSCGPPLCAGSQKNRLSMAVPEAWTAGLIAGLFIIGALAGFWPGAGARGGRTRLALILALVASLLAAGGAGGAWLA